MKTIWCLNHKAHHQMKRKRWPHRFKIKVHFTLTGSSKKTNKQNKTKSCQMDRQVEKYLGILLCWYMNSTWIIWGVTRPMTELPSVSTFANKELSGSIEDSLGAYFETWKKLALCSWHDKITLESWDSPWGNLVRYPVEQGHFLDRLLIVLVE